MICAEVAGQLEERGSERRGASGGSESGKWNIIKSGKETLVHVKPV